MTKLYVDGSPRVIAYCTGDGKSGFKNIKDHTSVEAEYLAIMYALEEMKEIGFEPPIIVYSDSETVVNQLNRKYHIKVDRIRWYAQKVWTLIEDMEVKFEWIPREKNLAGNILK